MKKKNTLSAEDIFINCYRVGDIANVYVMGYDKQESVMLGNLTILYKVSD